MRRCEGGLTANSSRQRAQRVRDLGWIPKHTSDETWVATMKGDVEAVMKGDKDHAVISLVGMGM